MNAPVWQELELWSGLGSRCAAVCCWLTEHPSLVAAFQHSLGALVSVAALALALLSRK